MSNYDFRENKEIQYMNRLSIVLKFELLNSLAEDVQKLFVQNLFFWSKHFWVHPLPLEFLVRIFLQSSLSYIEFRLFPTKL